MCNVSQGYIRHGFEIGLQIVGAVEFGRELGLDDAQIIDALVRLFPISEEDAAKYLAKILAKADNRQPKEVIV